MTEEEIMNLITELGGITRAFKDADSADKAEVYGRTGLTLTYHPRGKRVAAEARPESIMYVGACLRGDCTKKPMAAFGGVLAGGIAVSRRARRRSGVARLPLNASEG
jgi:hypothetical protein